MFEIGGVFLLAAFVAGLLMFLAPCTLPLVPAYIAFIAGTSETQLLQSNRSATKQALWHSVAFVLGFTVVFVTFGVLAGWAGGSFGVLQGYLARVGGVLIIVMGASMLGILRIPFLDRQHAFKIPAGITPGTTSGACVLGMIFALGWTPCIGPVLASILFIASSEGSVIVGGVLLSVFSLGLALPFLASAVAYGYMAPRLRMSLEGGRMITRIGGIFLILIGVLLALDSFGLLVGYGEILFRSIGFGALFEML